MRYLKKIYRLVKQHWLSLLMVTLMFLCVTGRLEFYIKYAKNLLGFGDRVPASK